MAFLRCLKKPPIEAKTLSVNRTNFPNSSVSTGDLYSTSTTDHSVYGHTRSTNSSASVTTGNFDTTGYSKLVINWSSNMSNSYIQVSVNGGSWGTVATRNYNYTYNLNGATTVNVRTVAGWNSGDNTWVSTSFNSIEFIP